MAKSKKAKAGEEAALRNKIKRLAVVALFSDNYLMDRLVLKGGNALDLVHHISSRASVDIDFSIEGDFDQSQRENLQARLEKALVDTFLPEGLSVFDVKCSEKPKGLSPDLAPFWGGYDIDFKLISIENRAELGENLDTLRRNAISIGQSQKFSIDISNHEYVAGKESVEFDGYTIYVYTPAMIICEKLRAICQQMDEYKPVIKRSGRSSTPRARDFFDIYTIMQHRTVDLTTPENHRLLRGIFASKRVNLILLRHIDHYRDMHSSDFHSVQDTVKQGAALNDFDFYFNFTIELVKTLEPLGDE